MATTRQLSLSGGELAPALYGRVDQTKYLTGVRTMRNAYIMRHGGAANRPGTTFIGEVKDSTAKVRLIPFIFNDAQTYVLELGNLYMRVIKAGAYTSDLSLTITGITGADPAVLTYTGTDPANGDEFAISGVVGMTQVNNRNFLVANVNAGANTFEMTALDGTNLDATGFGTYTSGGTAARVYTLTTPYETANLFALRYVQSANVVTVTHTSYQPREISRSGDAAWAIATITFAPSIGVPQNVSAGAGSTNSYRVTGIKDETFEESTQSGSASGGTVEVSPTSPVTVTWDQLSGARQYAIYRSFDSNKIWGLIGFAGDDASPSFKDIGVTPDTTDTPPDARDPFSGSSNWPLAVGYFQQRRAFANTTTDTQLLEASRTGFFKNFTISTPVQDDDAISFTMEGQQVNEIRHILEVKKPLVFTSSGEFSLNGDAAGIVGPFSVNMKQQGYNGCSNVPPLVVSDTALFIQERGNLVRDLNFDFSTEGFTGKDLTVFSGHLFENFTITDMAYQKIPHSVVWCVRSDGTLLALTYVREHELWGWSRHDTDGTIESVAAIPSGLETALYMVVNRTINGNTVRYVELMASRFVDPDNVEDSIFADSVLTYDGTNSAATTMTLSGGTTWEYDETMTLTASVAYFAATNVGDQIHLTSSDGILIRFDIDAFSSTTVVTGRPHKDVPATLQATATAVWGLALKTLTGIWHLEGENLSVFADGTVAASPNNATHDTVTVANGSITLDNHYVVIHAGLPYLTDIETLNIDRTGAETLMDKKKLITQVTMLVEKSRGIWAGGKPPTSDTTDPLEGLYELKIRDSENYDSPVDLKTGTVDIRIENTWNSNGRVFIRQVDPVPLTVLSIAPSGMIATR